jgi:hypothetical protein
MSFLTVRLLSDMTPSRLALKLWIATVRYLLLAGLAAFAHTAAAQPILLTFEDFPGMSNSPSAVIPASSRLSDFYLATHGVRFSSGAPFVAVVIHGSNTPSGVQLLGGSTPEGRLSYLQQFPIDASFFDAAGATRFVVSTVSVRGDLTPIPGTKTLEAYDLAGVLLDSDTQLDSSPLPLAVAAAGIHRVRMYSSSATIGFDDLRFDTPIAPGDCPSDLNRDGLVEDADFSIFIVAYDLLDCADPAMPPGCPADINNDGFVDDADFQVFVIAYDQLLCPS